MKGVSRALSVLLVPWTLLSIVEGSVARGMAASMSPVAKIVDMLKEMSAKSEEEGKAEAEGFSSFKCHSSKVIESKATKMSDLEELVSSLDNKIEKLTALKGELASKAVSVKKDLEKNDQTKREAESTRENSHKSFVSTEKEMTDNLKTLSQALTSLKETKKSEATELLAMSSNADLSALGRQLGELQDSGDFLSKKGLNRGLALLSAAPGDYEAQSGGVLGVLTSTRDTYAKDLETLQQTEASQKEAFEKMSATLVSEKKELTELLSMTEASRTGTEEEIETRKSQLKEAKKNLATETDLKEQEEKTLASKTAVYEERKSLRSEEEAAIAQTIAVLNSDSSFATFTAMTSKPAPSFLQLGRAQNGGEQSEKSHSRRAQAAQLLRQEARARSSAKLAHLAVLLSSETNSANPFAKVLGEIEKIKQSILAEGKADKKKFDWCAAERAKSKESKTEKETQIGNFKAELLELKETLTGPVDGLEATLAKAKEDLKENQDDQVKETEDRKKENKENNVANLQNAQGLIGQALSVLKKFYAKIALTQVQDKAQKQASAEPQYDEGDFEGQDGGKVQELLQAVLEDTAKDETKAHQAEQDAQKAFENRLALLTRSEQELEKTISDTKKAIADAKVEVTENKEMKGEAEKEKKSIKEYLENIKPQCDFITKNLDQRKANRAGEAESLEKAIELIKGTPAYKGMA